MVSAAEGSVRRGGWRRGDGAPRSGGGRGCGCRGGRDHANDSWMGQSGPSPSIAGCFRTVSEYRPTCPKKKSLSGTFAVNLGRGSAPSSVLVSPWRQRRRTRRRARHATGHPCAPTAGPLVSPGAPPLPPPTALVGRLAASAAGGRRRALPRLLPANKQDARSPASTYRVARRADRQGGRLAWRKPRGGTPTPRGGLLPPPPPSAPCRRPRPAHPLPPGRRRTDEHPHGPSGGAKRRGGCSRRPPFGRRTCCCVVAAHRLTAPVRALGTWPTRAAGWMSTGRETRPEVGPRC